MLNRVHVMLFAFNFAFVIAFFTMLVKLFSDVNGILYHKYIQLFSSLRGLILDLRKPWTESKLLARFRVFE